MALAYGAGGSYSVSMEGPFGGGGSSAKLTTVTVFAESWKGAESPYSQAVTVDGISVNSMVTLQPTAEQTEALRDMNAALTVVNDEGVATVYAIGEKPSADFTIQAMLEEVVA